MQPRTYVGQWLLAGMLDHRRRLFTGSVDMREITEFVEELRSLVHSTTPPDQLEAEALIRDGLGEDVDISGIGRMKIFTTHGAILGYAIRKLALSEPDIRKLILESERIAFEKGWNPPLAE